MEGAEDADRPPVSPPPGDGRIRVSVYCVVVQHGPQHQHQRVRAWVRGCVRADCLQPAPESQPR